MVFIKSLALFCVSFSLLTLPYAVHKDKVVAVSFEGQQIVNSELSYIYLHYFLVSGFVSFSLSSSFFFLSCWLAVIKKLDKLKQENISLKEDNFKAKYRIEQLLFKNGQNYR
jgi:hypothetical protein